MNNSNGGQQQRPQVGQFGTQNPQPSQMTNITGMQMPSGQIRYHINSQPQPGMVHVVGMPQGNIQMQSTGGIQSQPQQQQYQQVGMILSNQPMQMRPQQTSQPQSQQQQTISFSPQGQQFYIQQPTQMQSVGPGRQIYQVQTTPNGPQPVFTNQTGRPQLQPQQQQPFFTAQNIQQRPMSAGGQPTRLVPISPHHPVGIAPNRPVYHSMPPQGFAAPPGQQHHQTKLGESPGSRVSTTSHGSALQASSSQPWIEESKEVLTKKRLEDLVKEVDQYEVLEEDVKDALLQLSDDFIETVVRDACQIAKHRKSRTLDVKDVQLCLERNWNMWIPGFGTDDLKPYKKAPVTDAHKQRMALIRKNLKKGT